MTPITAETFLLAILRHSRSWTPGTLVTLIGFFCLLGLIIHLIEKNHHDDSSGSKVFIFGGLTICLGVIGATIGAATKNHADVILYYSIYTIVGGFVAAEYLFDYSWGRTFSLITPTPTTLFLCYTAGNAFDSWLFSSLMK
ncbi:MAG: hypothetical protein ACPG32_13850 [Akkermansiaceae bacterium]